MKKKLILVMVVIIGVYSQLAFSFAQEEDDFPRMFSVVEYDNPIIVSDDIN